MAASVQGGSIAYGPAGTTNGTTAFVDAGGPFVPAQVGFNITIKGAGPAGADLQTTMAAYVSPTTITLANAASNSATQPYFFGPAGGAISSNWTTTISVTLSIAQSVGDAFGVGCNDDFAHSPATVADTAGNTFTQRGTGIVEDEEGYREIIWSSTLTHASAASANSITVTFDAIEQGYTETFWRHFSGVGTWSQVAQSNNSNNPDTNVTTGNFGSTVTSGSAIWGFSGVGSHVSAAGTGYTASVTNFQGDAEEYQIVGTSGTFELDFTQSSNESYVVSGIVFNPGVTASKYNLLGFGASF